MLYSSVLKAMLHVTAMEASQRLGYHQVTEQPGISQAAHLVLGRLSTPTPSSTPSPPFINALSSTETHPMKKKKE
ncbi:hypothetical protein FKM82_022137 [Ascaphus truei]